MFRAALIAVSLIVAPSTALAQSRAVDLDRFDGRWFEIERSHNDVQKDCSRAQIDFTPLDRPDRYGLVVTCTRLADGRNETLRAAALYDGKGLRLAQLQHGEHLKLPERYRHIEAWQLTEFRSNQVIALPRPGQAPGHLLLVASSELNANPADTKNYPKGVYALPPTLAMGNYNKAEYLRIGESDRMTLKFVKPVQ